MKIHSLQTLACALGFLFVAPLAAAGSSPQINVSIRVNTARPGPTISPDIFGQFSEHLGHGIYGGIWVGPDSAIPNTQGLRNDVIGALKKLHVPVLRWPGGCFADQYDWRDGVGPRDQRPTRVNTSWGYVAESNAFGTHEFMRFARLIGARAYVNGNMGSEPPALMAKWVRYMTAAGSSKLANERRANGRKMPWQVAYFGLGNETWGCGGNMSAKYAANRTKRYATFIPRPPGSHIKLVASGPNADDFHFTKVMMKKAGGMVDALSLHYYTFTHDYRHKGPALGFDEAQWASTLKHAEHMGELIEKHVAIMDRYDPKKRVALVVDEWGGWFDPVHKHRTYSRQVTLRDALIAALTFDIFQRHADRVRMANIAQMINVGQALILTDGPKMVRTPTYWAYDLYQPFKGAKALPARVDTPDYEQGHVSLPAVDASAALGSDGRVHLALVNVDPDRPARVKVSLGGVTPRGAAGKVLTGARMDAHNTFAHPGAVQPADFSGKVADGELVFRLPAESVAVVTFRK